MTLAASAPPNLAPSNGPPRSRHSQPVMPDLLGCAADPDHSQIIVVCRNGDLYAVPFDAHQPVQRLSNWWDRYCQPPAEAVPELPSTLTAAPIEPLPAAPVAPIAEVAAKPVGLVQGLRNWLWYGRWEGI